MARTKQTARKCYSASGITKAPTQNTPTPAIQADLDAKKLKSSLDAVSLSDLKSHLSNYKLPVTGLRKALQLRLFNHMIENKINHLPGLPTTSTTKSSSESELESDAETVADLKSEDEEESEEENEDGEVVWQWADDSSKGSQDLWRDYSAALQSKLNAAYQKKQKKVRVDTQRFVDLSQTPYLQKRYDDPSRRRLVQRYVKPTSSKKKSKSPKRSTSPKTSKKAKEEEKEEKEESSDSDLDIDLESDSESSKDEDEEEEELSAEWLWAGDSPGGGHQDIWVPYSTTLSKKIEDSWNKGEKEVKVDDERFVDLQNMLQRRYDDKMKRRSIKRKANTVVKTKTMNPPKTKVSKNAVKAVVTKKAGKLVIGSKSYQKKKLQQNGVALVSDDEEEEEEQKTKVKTGKRKRIDDDSDSDDEKPKKKSQKTEDFSFAKQLGLPDTWGAHSSMNTSEVVIPKSSDEFKNIQKMMGDTIAGYHKNNSGNHPVKFTKLEVSKVVRVQNPLLWIRYTQRKEALVKEYSPAPSNSVGTVLTGTSTDASVNEYFLFHGLNENGIPGITRFGFDPRYCSLKGMFGAGLYFADNSSKANQYCHGGSCTASGFLTGRAQCRCKKTEEACVMLCRVALGDPFIEKKYRGNSDGEYWNGRRKEVEKTKRGQTGVYNSVIGESKVNGGNTLLLREYVVYDSAQVYPEYIVYYYRK